MSTNSDDSLDNKFKMEFMGVVVVLENLTSDLRVWGHQHTNIQLAYIQKYRDIYKRDMVESTCSLFRKVDPGFEPFSK